MRRLSLGAVVAAGAILFGCHTITEELPTEPSEAAKPTTGLLTVPIPALTLGSGPNPAPTPTPAPSPAEPAPPPPSPEPAPTPEPPESAGGCAEPLPPPVQKMKAKVHLRGGSSPVKSQRAKRKRVPRYYYESRSRYFRKRYGRTGALGVNLIWTAGRGIHLAREVLTGTPRTSPELEWRDNWIGVFERTD